MYRTYSIAYPQGAKSRLYGVTAYSDEVEMNESVEKTLLKVAILGGERDVDGLSLGEPKLYGTYASWWIQFCRMRLSNRQLFGGLMRH